MKRSSLLVILSLVISTLASTVLWADSTVARREAAGIYSWRIWSHIYRLASEEFEGRGSGTPGNEAAARYIAEQFAQYGLKPVGTARYSDLQAPMDRSGYFQPFRVFIGSEPGKNNHFEATVNGKRLVFKIGEDFVPDASAATATASGALVFAGYGIHSSIAGREDYANLDVKDKVVVVLEGSPATGQGPNLLRAFQSIRTKARGAKEQGATALVVLQRQDAPLTQNLQGRSSDSGIPVVVLRRRAADRLLQAMGVPLSELLQNPQGRPLNNAVARLQTEVAPKYAATANIVGLVEGTDPELKKEYIVIGAHMDHLGWGYQGGSMYSGKLPAIHYGADDNASGTAGLLELAQYYAANPTSRSLVFIAFSGEEIGLIGSTHYARNPIFPLEQTVAMLNMDMIGRLRNEQLAVIGVGSSPVWRPLLTELNREAGFKLELSESGFGGSDHVPFFTRKIPVLFFFTGMHPEYHTPNDKPELINAAGQARVVRFVANVIERIANSGEKLPFTEPSAPARPRGGERAFRVYVGTIPDFSDEGKGLLLSGAREGSPAHRAGLRAGDLIIRFGDTKVLNIYDYMDAMNRYKPGDVVAITFIRDGKEHQVQVTLEARAE